MLKLKVCGMKDQLNINELVKLNPDFIGFIFHEKSPRNISEYLEVYLPSSIEKVGVFVNETEGFILDRIEQFEFKYIQLHGNESPHFCKKIQLLNRKVIKAFNIHKDFDFSSINEYEPYCEYFLFDAFGKNAGGNGITFNWKLLDNYKGETPFFLGGGIDLELTKSIKKIKHPMFKGIDINSKFEVTPGIKNIEKIKEFKDELFNK